MTSKPRAFTPPDYYEHYYETSWKRDTFDNLNKFDKEVSIRKYKNRKFLNK